MNMATNKFIQEAVARHPGRVKKYIEREFGSKAFEKKGTIKEKYINLGIRRAKAKGETSLERALLLAKTLKTHKFRERA
jgi:hypothetical protein